MGHTVTIRVHYPLSPLSARSEDTLALRTDADWSADVEPAAVASDGTRFDFPVLLTAPFFYFKPVLRRGGEILWSQGESWLALADGPETKDIYPHFLSDNGSGVSDLLRLPSQRGPRRHSMRIFHPPGYAENTLARYPVLFMQDGQNLFFPQEAFGGHDWMVSETLGVLDAMSLVREAIVVGVYPQDRMADYTKPGYEEYGRYLVEEVKPWVDASYRTLSGPADTVVMGSSLGGVVSLYLAWQWPEVFGNAGCLSSTFGYRDDLHERIEAEPKRPIKIYLDSGWPRDNYEVTRTMRNTLRSRGYEPGRDLFYLAFPRARHDEESWAMRAHIPFQFFFGQ
jgi:predicted alpha/beta superfamily hydrolase